MNRAKGHARWSWIARFKRFLYVKKSEPSIAICADGVNIPPRQPNQIADIRFNSLGVAAAAAEDGAQLLQAGAADWKPQLGFGHGGGAGTQFFYG